MTTSIEWTDKTWNPIIGCSRISKGCEHCYAERVAHRGLAEQHRGLTVVGRHGPRWNGTVRFVPAKLGEPLRWRKPCRVFVNSMSDLFHEGVSDDQIAAIFGVMAACPQHTFQVLTKRPERMRRWFRWIVAQDQGMPATPGLLHANLCALNAEAEHHPLGDGGPLHTTHCADPDGPWPLPNVWLGVSVEDQATADERIPLLLDTPAAVRWVSYEPALGPVDFREHLSGDSVGHETGGPQGWVSGPGLDWIVIGGESGPGARPFDLAWARSTIEACRAAGVPVFFKQAGARPHDGARRSIVDRHGVVAPSLSPEEAERLAPGYEGGRVEPAWLRLRDRKGGGLSELPKDLRVREMPEVRHA